MYNNNRKRQDLKRLCHLYDYLIKSNRHGNGGYSAFMEKIINRMIISKIANSNFFTISTILTFHKHPSFHRLGIAACICKGGHNRRWINPPLRKSCLIGLLRQSYHTPKLYIFQDLLLKCCPATSKKLQGSIYLLYYVTQ